MVDQLDELYREVILDHFKAPHHKGALPEPAITEQGANPLCGDELTYYVRLAGDRITQVGFTGTGCAISQAAASMLAQQLEDRTITDAAKLIEALKQMMQGRAPDPSVDLGDLESLAGVRKFPVRVKCAALSWNVAERVLQKS